MIVCYLAHCLLNANAKVDEGARCAGVSVPVLRMLRERGATIRQMPCPELAFGGTRRFWAVREQYATPAYRAHCRRLAEPMAAQVRADLAAGARVVIIGIDGSPSMGVELTAADETWGGRPDKPRDEDYPVTPGAGLYTETLLGLLGEGVKAVRAVGIGQDLLDYDEQRELAKLGRIVAGEAERAVRGDGRSRRVAVVPDAYLNPAAGAPDRLAELAGAGWGVVALPQPGLAPDTEAAALAAVVDQLAAFLDDGYQVALAEPDDPAAQRLDELLAAAGRRIGAGLAP